MENHEVLIFLMGMVTGIVMFSMCLALVFIFYERFVGHAK